MAQFTADIAGILEGEIDHATYQGMLTELKD